MNYTQHLLIINKGKESGKNRFICTYNWITFLYTWNTTLKKTQLYFNKKSQSHPPKKQTSNKTTTATQQKKSYCLYFSPGVCGARYPPSWESRVSPPGKSLLKLVSDRITFFVGWGQVREWGLKITRTVYQYKLQRGYWGKNKRAQTWWIGFQNWGGCHSAEKYYRRFYTGSLDTTIRKLLFPWKLPQHLVTLQ